MEIDYNINENYNNYWENNENQKIINNVRIKFLGDYIEENESTHTTNEVIMQQTNINNNHQEENN